MNKKILVIALAFIFLAMLAAPLVSAKPTSAANNPKSISFLWHSENGASTPVDVMTNPPWAEGDEVIVTHTQAVWNLNPAGNNYVQTVAHSPTLLLFNYRVYEKVMWDCNYIEIMCLERASADLSGPVPVFYASGTFNGHGVIDGQKVQVTGIREGFVDPMIGFVLECYGTIRFAGNA